MNLIEYLNIDITTEKGVNDVFGFIESHLNKLYETGGSYNLVTPLEKIYNKVIECIEYYGKTQDEYNIPTLFEHISKIHDFAILSRDGRFTTTGSRFYDPHQYLYSKTLQIYDDIKKEIESRKGDDIFHELLDKNISTKETLIALLSNCIKLIESNPSLPDKAKAQIIDNITSAINEAKSKTTNWSKFLGKVKQAGILLTAVVAITGYSLKDLIEAKDNLEQTINIVQETTINNITITNQLNIQNNIRLIDGNDKHEKIEPEK